MKNPMTLGEKYGPAMDITDQLGADAYFSECVAHRMAMTGTSRAQAEEIERSNLGYWAGYYDQQTRLRVERLFHCEHPVLGAAADGQLSEEEILLKGMEKFC